MKPESFISMAEIAQMWGKTDDMRKTDGFISKCSSYG